MKDKRRFLAVWGILLRTIFSFNPDPGTKWFWNMKKWTCIGYIWIRVPSLTFDNSYFLTVKDYKHHQLFPLPWHPLITDLFHSWPSLLSSSCESWPPRPAGPPALTFLKVDCEAKLAPSPLSSPDSSNLSSVKVDRSVRLAFSPLPFPLFLKSHLCEGWPPRPAAPLFPVTISSFNNHRIFSGYY